MPHPTTAALEKAVWEHVVGGDRATCWRLVKNLLSFLPGSVVVSQGPFLLFGRSHL